jgi:RHS repeat-associated protein
VPTQQYTDPSGHFAFLAFPASYHLLADHLGSTASTVSSARAKVAELRYKAWGEIRYTWGTPRTTFRFTGQRIEESLGLYHMGARWYDPRLARWLSADSIVPSPANPQGLNRYSWVLNSPLMLVDPTGHGGVAWWDVLINAGKSVASSVQSWIGSKSEPYAATVQAVGLAVEWFVETGEPERAIGPDAPLTQEVRHDPQIDVFCEHWAAAGHPLPFSEPTSIDPKSGPLVSRLTAGFAAYGLENTELGLSLLGLGSTSFEGRIDAVGGILGSFDKVTVSDAGEGLVKIEVVNKMTWQSATRIPGTDWWLVKAVWLGETSLGAKAEHTFYWWDSVYADDSCY